MTSTYINQSQWHQPVIVESTSLENLKINSYLLTSCQNSTPTTRTFICWQRRARWCFVRFIFGCPTAAGKEATTSLRDASLQTFGISLCFPNFGHAKPRNPCICCSSIIQCYNLSVMLQCYIMFYLFYFYTTTEIPYCSSIADPNYRTNKRGFKQPSADERPLQRII